MSRAQTPSTDATAQLYARSQDAVVSLKVELQKARTEVARLTHDALILRDQNRRLLDDQEQLSLARRDAEGKLRFRMRQVLELEHERTSFAMKEGEMLSQIGDLEEKWTSMCKELNDTKTEMKVLAARRRSQRA
jgi:chromosome segregation ATPase